MATPNNVTLIAPGGEHILPVIAEGHPPLPSEQGSEHFNREDRVLALYYRTWMDEPELVEGIVDDIDMYDQPAPNGSPGCVNIKTAKTPDNPTGSIIGIDMNNVALIPESALARFSNETFLETWLADGTEAWPGELKMLERLLRERIAGGNIGLDAAGHPHDDRYGGHHPSRARAHLQTVPGSIAGKVRDIPPLDAKNV